MRGESVCSRSIALDSLRVAPLTALRLLTGTEGTLSACYEDAAAFFELPAAARERNLLPFGCGYWPYGREHSGAPAKPDRVDFFAASARTVEAAERLPSEAGRRLHRRLMGAFALFEPLAEDLLADAATALAGADAARSIRGGLRRWSQMQVSRTLPTSAGRLTHYPHEDGHVLTFAHADGPGLEVAYAGEYRPVQRPRQTVVVMAGGILTLVTGGRIPPTYHRVRAAASGRHRYSMLFFADLDPALCVPWLHTEFNRGVDIAQRVLSNAERFGVDGFTVE